MCRAEESSAAGGDDVRADAQEVAGLQERLKENEGDEEKKEKSTSFSSGIIISRLST